MPPGCSITFLTEQVKTLVQGMADAFPAVCWCLMLPTDGGEDDRQNMAQKRENQGCGRIFCGFGRSQKRDWRVGQPFAGHQPGLYAGLQRSERPVRQRLFPFLAKVGDGMMKMQIVKINF